MNRNQIITETREMLNDFGIIGYRVEVSPHMKKTYGVCNYTRRTIKISGPLAAVNSDEETRNTIAHEVAHAIAGPGAGHGPKWKDACALTGARPERCYGAEVEAAPARYHGTCQACGEVVVRRDRMTKNMKDPYRTSYHRVSRCAVGGNNLARRIEWVDTKEAAVAHIPAPVVPSPTPRPTMAVAAHQGTIACVGTCGEVRPATKFPTTKDGGRGTECRDCQKARRAATRRA